MKTASRRRAFTFVEILVVCVVIGILAGILLGVFQRVRENGRRSVCLNNLHQLSLALQQYVQDNDSRFPADFDQGHVLLPYVKNEKLLYCPSSPSGEGRYDMQTWLQDFDIKANKVYGRHEVVVPEISTIMSLCEIINTDEPSEEVMTVCGSKITVAHRHFNGTNNAFVDGHVEWLSAQQLGDAICKSQRDYPGFYEGH